MNSPHPKNDSGTRRVSLVRVIIQAPAKLLLALVWLYQRTLSPALPVLFPNCGCRFSPSCSHYAADAVRRHGAIVGSGLALIRLLKCTPLHPGGIDPVPDSIRRRPVCRQTKLPSASLVRGIAR